MKNILDEYNTFGPFQISQGLCYIKNTYVPFEIGTWELNTIINNRIASLEEEKVKWLRLDSANMKALREAGEV
tara:strand:+ start:578 stop:796 length:219 start_codon:yes stop_codon:yes gene_type:complete